jgi:nitric oxide reductase subunit B
MELSRRTLAKILAAVFVFNLVVMGAGAWYSQQNVPPIPKETVGPDGSTVVTDHQIQQGKIVFQSNGFMDQGTILGNGGYYGVDYTADALRLQTRYMRQFYAEREYDAGFGSLPPPKQAAINATVKGDLEDGSVGETIHLSAAEAYAYDKVEETYVERYYEGSPERGVPEKMIATPEEARQFADFALWTAWIAHTERPGSTQSFTNDWPYMPGAGNVPTGPTLTWSVIAVVLLIAGAGIGIWLYQSVDLAEPSTVGVEIPEPDDVTLHPSQVAASKFVVVAAVLFFAQTLLGGLIAHYYIERHGFYGIAEAVGIEPLKWLPFYLGRTWHIDLAILWIATLWIGAGLFLPPLLTGYEPPNQARYIRVLLAALVVVAVGGLAGIWLGAHNYFEGGLWWILGNEGLEYLEVGRLWQVGLLVGFLLWAALVTRGLKPLLDRESRYGIAHMVLYAGGSIALLFVAGFLYTPQTNIVMTEFWRWWVVHMWVEGAFEFFVVTVVALTLVSMNLLEKSAAEKAVLFEALLVMGAGVIGVSHHYWWVGQPSVWLPFGSVFSTLELIPLVFILYEALNEYRVIQETDREFPYRLPFMFIVASGVWNFVGGGVLGFFINLPLINYYEHGTYLTVAHAHAAMFGAFGFLALGMAVYVLRIVTRSAAWSTRRLRWAFWLWNIGLAVMLALSVLPVGFIQLEAAFTGNYAAARSLAFYNQPIIQLLFWIRFPGDTMIILGSGVFLWDVAEKLLATRETTTELDESTFTVFGSDDD